MDNDPNTQEKCQQAYTAGGPGRQNVSEVLRQKARRLHAEAVGLEKLAEYAQYLPPDLDETLWKIVLRIDG